MISYSECRGALKIASRGPKAEEVDAALNEVLLFPKLKMNFKCEGCFFWSNYTPVTQALDRSATRWQPKTLTTTGLMSKGGINVIKITISSS